MAEECVGVAHGTAQDATNDVAGFCVARQLAVCNGEGDGPKMVGHHAHGHVCLLLFTHTFAVRAGWRRKTIAFATECFYLFDDRLEDIGVVVAVLVLQHAHESLETHAGVDDMHGQWGQTSVGFAVVLHEDEVPNLNHLWIIFIDKVASGHFGFLFRCAGIHVNLRARTARSRVAHLPKVVVFVAIDDVIGRNMLGPIASRLVIACESLLFCTFKHGDIQVIGVQMKHVYEVFPCIIDGTFLEIIAETPVAQHLEHRVMIGVMAHFLKVVVLSAHAKTLLRVHPTNVFSGVFRAKDNVFPLVHTGICEHQRRVILDNHRC